MTLEPTESYSRADLDAYAAALADIARQAREDPAAVKAGPVNSTVHRLDASGLDDPERWALTWRAWQRKVGPTGRG